MRLKSFPIPRDREIKKRLSGVDNLFKSCEEKDRTSDLRVMSPTSYRCSTSRSKSNGIMLCCQMKYLFIYLQLKRSFFIARISGVLSVRRLR